MSQFIETIRILNRKPENIHWHNLRLNKTRDNHFSGIQNIDLEDVFGKIDIKEDGLLKLTVYYSKEIEDIKLVPYEIKKINSLQCIYNDLLDYKYKYSNRENLDLCFANRKNADDILIIKNQKITDSFYCNVALSMGSDWHTPKFPLLKGTRRNQLLEKGIIVEKDIEIKNINNYQKIALFNAMIPWENRIEINVDHIYL